MPVRPLAVQTRRLTHRVSAGCFVEIDTIRYSVPHRYVRETVEVVAGLKQVEVWLRGACVARHRLCLEPGSWVKDGSDFQGLYRPETASTMVPPPSSQARPLSVYAEVMEGGRA